MRFLRALRLAADWLYDPANGDTAVAILVERTRQDERHARQTYDLAVAQERIYAEGGRIRPEGVQAVIELLAEVGELERPLPSADKYIASSYWEQAGGRP